MSIRLTGAQFSMSLDNPFPQTAAWAALLGLQMLWVVANRAHSALAFSKRRNRKRSRPQAGPVMALAVCRAAAIGATPQPDCRGTVDYDCAWNTMHAGKGKEALSGRQNDSHPSNQPGRESIFYSPEVGTLYGSRRKNRWPIAEMKAASLSKRYPRFIQWRASSITSQLMRRNCNYQNNKIRKSELELLNRCKNTSPKGVDYVPWITS